MSVPHDYQAISYQKRGGSSYNGVTTLLAAYGLSNVTQEPHHTPCGKYYKNAQELERYPVRHIHTLAGYAKSK